MRNIIRGVIWGSLIVGVLTVSLVGCAMPQVEVRTPSHDVIGSPELDTAAVAVLAPVASGKAVEVGGLLCAAADGSIEQHNHTTGTRGEVSVRFERGCLALYHSHPRSRESNANRVNRLPSMPTNFRRKGGSDATALLYGLPNYYRDPFGAVRVLEFRNGAYMVRTVSGDRLDGEADYGLQLWPKVR